MESQLDISKRQLRATGGLSKKVEQLELAVNKISSEVKFHTTAMYNVLGIFGSAGVALIFAYANQNAHARAVQKDVQENTANIKLLQEKCTSDDKNKPESAAHKNGEDKVEEVGAAVENKEDEDKVEETSAGTNQGYMSAIISWFKW